MLSSEESVECEGFEHVSLVCTGGVGIDIVYVFGFHSGHVHGSLHGDEASAVGGLADSASIGGESVAYYFGEDGCSALDCALVFFEHQGGGSSAGHESVAISVEGSGCFLWLVHALTEGVEGIEGGHAIEIGFLCSSA